MFIVAIIIGIIFYTSGDVISWYFGINDKNKYQDNEVCSIEDESFLDN